MKSKLKELQEEQQNELKDFTEQEKNFMNMRDRMRLLEASKTENLRKNHLLTPNEKSNPMFPSIQKQSRAKNNSFSQEKGKNSEKILKLKVLCFSL